MQRFIEYCIENGGNDYNIEAIQKIQDIPVVCSFNTENEEIYKFEITSVNGSSATIFCQEFPASMSAEEISKSIIMFLKNIKFSKYVGRFLLRGDEDYEACDEQDLVNELAEIDGIKLHGDKCCVCHDYTLEETDCGHHLCLICLSNLKPTKFENECCPNKKCPMCRQIIN